jgi:hypothetical protein
MWTVRLFVRPVWQSTTDHATELPDRVTLPKSGIHAERDNVYITIRKNYAKFYKIAASTVVTARSVKSQLIDIATVAESASKARLLDRHDDWLETLDAAVEAVEKHSKKSEKALKLLDLEEDIKEFSKGIHQRATRRAKVVRSAKKKVLDLVDDLQNFIHDQ